MGETYYPERKSQETLDAEELQQRKSMNKSSSERPKENVAAAS
jgi:hypothetical protein